MSAALFVRTRPTRAAWKLCRAVSACTRTDSSRSTMRARGRTHKARCMRALMLTKWHGAGYKRTGFDVHLLDGRDVLLASALWLMHDAGSGRQMRANASQTAAAGRQTAPALCRRTSACVSAARSCAPRWLFRQRRVMRANDVCDANNKR